MWNLPSLGPHLKLLLAKWVNVGRDKKRPAAFTGLVVGQTVGQVCSGGQEGGLESKSCQVVGQEEA